MQTKILTLMALVCFFKATTAQYPGRIVKATSVSAHIVEGGDIFGWRINPHIQLDIHTISKSPHARRVRFCTDIDTLEVRLRPGHSVDFIVLLNGRDSCHTRLQSLPLANYAYASVRHDTLPFRLTAYNNLSFSAVVNGKDTLWLAFDSGSTGLLLTDSVLNVLKDVNPDSSGNSLALNRLAWDDIPVYQVRRTPMVWQVCSAGIFLMDA